MHSSMWFCTEVYAQRYKKNGSETLVWIQNVQKNAIMVSRDNIVTNEQLQPMKNRFSKEHRTDQ